MASIKRRTRRLLNFLLGVLLLPVERGGALELLPSTTEVLLQSQSNYTVLCSGWSPVRWTLPEDSKLDDVQIEDQGTTSILQLSNVTWETSGRYSCEEKSADQRKHVDIFIPGRDPSEWFVPTRRGIVMKERLVDTVPCVVSDPWLNVSLYDRSGMRTVSGMTFDPALGFTGPLNDTSYVCVASNGGNETESQVFYVFSIEVHQEMEVDLSASSSVLKQGEVLTINCTVRNADNVFFSWSFPRRQEIEPVTDLLSDEIRSFIHISEATVEDSGLYVCEAGETKQGRRVEKKVTITVLDRGYVYMLPPGEPNVSYLLHDTAVLTVEVDAHPTPTIIWTRGNKTVPVDTTFINTTLLKDNRYLSTLTLQRLLTSQTGNYTATAYNEDDSEEVSFYLEVKAPPSILSLLKVGSNTAVCVSEGAPPPAITWYTCHGSQRCDIKNGGWRNISEMSEGVTLQQNITAVVERGVSQVRSVLILRTLSSVSAFRCEARNSVGGRSQEKVLSNPLLSEVVVLAAILVLVIMAIIFLIILIILWRKKPSSKSGWRLIDSVSSDGKQISYVHTEDLSYSAAWEIPRDSIAPGKVLGAGGFGRIVEATIPGPTGSSSTTKVAVKMVKSRTDAVQFLMSELKVLSHLGPHLNIVNMLGACTRRGPLYLITEFCSHGDLRTYLQRNKDGFLKADTPSKSDCDGGYMDITKEESAKFAAMKELGHADTEPALSETPHMSADQHGTPSLLNDSSLLTLNDLISFSFQTCQAMDFLSSRKCVHGDLAARNVLVADGKLVKVCDFTLARDLEKDHDYIFRRNEFLPLKWMSPESLFQNIHSSHSDVWSFGVLMWEIFSLGSRPYSDISTSQEFCSALKNGLRLDQPEHAPQTMYDLMKRCWDDEPHSRPSFSSLVVSLGNMLSDDFKQRYIQLTEIFQKKENPVRSGSSPNRKADRRGHAQPMEKVHLLEAELVEDDNTVEDKTRSALDAASPQTSQTPAILQMEEAPEQEVTFSDIPSVLISSHEEEESCM